MRIKDRFGWSVVLILAMCLVAMADTANRSSGQTETRMPGRTDVVLQAWQGQAGPWVAPRNEGNPLDVGAAYWVDNDFVDDTTVDNFNPALTYGLNAFGSIQAAINVAGSGDTVNVLPGSYVESAPNSFLFDATGPYQFGLFISQFKNDLTVRGVNASGTPIGSYGTIAADVLCMATNGFGPSGIFVEGDGVTITGLAVRSDTTIGINKTIEVIGDDFTLKYCRIEDYDPIWDYGGSLYFGDFRYDSGTSTSHIQIVPCGRKLLPARQ